MDEIDDENQEFKMNNNSNYKFRYREESSDFNDRVKSKIKTFFIVFILIILLVFIMYIIKSRISKSNLGLKENKKINLERNEPNTNIKSNINTNKESHIKKEITESTKKLGICFVCNNIYSNGMARFITLTSDYFVNSGKYNVYFITGPKTTKEFKFNEKIQRFIALNDFPAIKRIIKNNKIDFFILNNILSQETVKSYKSLGAKVIGVYHGSFMSSMFSNNLNIYKNWDEFDSYDSFIFLSPDDYYFYNNLKFKHHIFIPNLYTFEPTAVKESNLTYNNILMIGRENDKIKGVLYAVKAMSLIVKEVPDARLQILTSDSRIQFLENLAKELNLSNNVFIIHQRYDISKFFYNSSILMYTSLSEGYPMVMNEGKAFGLPIVAFDVPVSIPYQSGVITVDSLDYKSLAKESIKLLKNYDYRKKMGKMAKDSLNNIKNEDIIDLWGFLFDALLEGKDSYKLLQKDIMEKYYQEKRALIHLKKHFSDLKKYNTGFSCFSLEKFIDNYSIKHLQPCK